jgi:hypothetical protein
MTTKKKTKVKAPSRGGARKGAGRKSIDARITALGEEMQKSLLELRVGLVSDVTKALGAAIDSALQRTSKECEPCTGDSCPVPSRESITDAAGPVEHDTEQEDAADTGF